MVISRDERKWEEFVNRMDRVSTNRIASILDNKLKPIIKDMVRDEIEEYLRTISREELLQILLKNDKEDFEEVKKETVTEKNCDMELKNIEEFKIETEESVIKRLASKLTEILGEEEVESEEMFIEKILEFFRCKKDENEKMQGKLDDLQSDYDTATGKLDTLQSRYNTVTGELDALQSRYNTATGKLKDLQSGYDTVTGELNALQSRYNIATGKLKDLQSDYDTVTGELNTLQSRYEQQNKELISANEKIDENEKEKNKLQALYNIAKLYDKYMRISEKTRDELENLIRTEDIGSFITCCYQLSTMDDIWEFVSLALRDGTLPNEDCEVLREIFTYFIQQKNKMYRESLYRVYIPEKGEYYDAAKHLDVDRNGADKVKEVVFPGYGILEDKIDPNQPDEERKIKKLKKFPIVKTI